MSDKGGFVHPSAIVSDRAKIGRNTRVGPFTVIHDNVVLGEGSVIDGHCEIGYPTPLAGGKRLVIGAGAVIRSHTVIYEGSIFGDGLTTGHHAVARENVIAGRNLQLGSFSELQGDTEIGDYTRTQSSVLIGKQTRIGNFVWIFSYSGIANDPHPPSGICLGVTIEDYTVIAANCVILPDVTLGTHCLVAAQSCVHADVPAYAVVSGDPARVRGRASNLRLRDGSRQRAYPWPRHFHRGYPEDVVRRWVEDFQYPDKKIK